MYRKRSRPFTSETLRKAVAERFSACFLLSSRIRWFCDSPRIWISLSSYWTSQWYSLHCDSASTHSRRPHDGLPFRLFAVGLGHFTARHALHVNSSPTGLESP